MVGEGHRSHAAELLLRRLYYRETEATELSPDLVHLYLQESGVEALNNSASEQMV